MDKAAMLAAKARKGDKQAFGELYAMFMPEMYRFALYSLSSRENALDAVQDTALEGFRSIGRLRDEEKIKSWFFGILSHVCKKKQREKYLASFTELESCFDLSEGDKTEELENAVFLAQQMAKLNEDERDIINLSVFGGLNSTQIAEITGLLPGTVRSKLSRALAQLRKKVE